VRRADRLFDIIQRLRTARGPLTAAAIAEQLEVTVRTVYRDIAALQARRVPIEGAAGIGYVLRRGFDLPPLMFTTEEVDAIVTGARLVRRLRDPRLQEAADSVLAKVATVLDAPVFVSSGSTPVAEGVDLAEVRSAIHAARKLRIGYLDGQGLRTQRTIWPIAMAYYVDVTLIAAWCELRNDFRHFRVDRIVRSTLLDERFPTDHAKLLADWLALPKDREALLH
jgi:predicted DNA-binding transcriptional regulator YafY